LYNADGYATVRGWDSCCEPALIRSCLQYNATSGEFTVGQDHDGLYVLTSHLAFLGPSSSGEVFAQKVIQSDVGQPILVDQRRGVKLSAGNVPVHTSLAAGVARLRPGQPIYISAKPVHKLARGNGLSYFSIIKLQNG